VQAGHKLGVIGLAVLSALALAVPILSHCGGAVVTIVRSHRGALTEDDYVHLSRQALRKVVKDFVDYEPQPYNGTNLFAANIYNTNAGYVLWVRKTNTEQGFRVAMEVEGSNVVCQVIRFK
jgi:hypothetical protein